MLNDNVVYLLWKFEVILMCEKISKIKSLMAVENSLSAMIKMADQESVMNSSIINRLQ